MGMIEEIYGALRGAVEKTVGREMKTTTDFDPLAASRSGNYLTDIKGILRVG